MTWDDTDTTDERTIAPAEGRPTGWVPLVGVVGVVALVWLWRLSL